MSMTLMMLAMSVAAPEAVVGLWKTETRNGIVEIARCGASLCGKLLTSDGIAANPDLKDVENSNAALRSRPLKNLQILSGFHYADGAWKGGTIYKADNGKTYDATITPIDANRLKLRGCIVFPLCSSQIWTRVR